MILHPVPKCLIGIFVETHLNGVGEIPQLSFETWGILLLFVLIVVLTDKSKVSSQRGFLLCI